MKCCQCGKPAVITYGEGKNVMCLCVDCNLKFQEATEMAYRRNVEMINYITAQIEAGFGMYGMFPRYQVTSPIIHQGEIKLNNINVSNSVIGAINTGTVQSIDVSLSVMKSKGDGEIVKAIAELTKQIIEFKEMTADQKNEILEQLSFISEELSKPKGSQRWSVIKTVLSTIGSMLSGFHKLVEIWEKLRSLLPS